MKRRAFITLLASAAAWPFAARAQQAKRPIIGFLGTATPSTWGSFTAAFVQRLRELGWTDGGNITVEARWAEGRTERYAEIAAEFVRRKVDVIVTSGGAVPAAKQATSTIPIVFTLARDPVAAGWVASLARPGGNITGLSAQTTEIAGKRLELLREIILGLRRLAEWKILRPPSRRSRIAQKRFISHPTPWSLLTEFASIRWCSARDCRRCSVSGSMSRWEV
jgi:ABC-type uncharacterized transport system substrate-binding protein